MFQYFNQLLSTEQPSWVIKIDGNTNDNLDSISITEEGLGYSSGYQVNSNQDLVFFKFTNTGEIVQQRRIDASNVDGSTGVATDGNFVYMTGYTNSSGAGNFDLILFKFSSTGEIIWQKTYGTSSQDTANDIKLLSNGDPVVVGSNGSNIVITRINSNTGSFEWQKKVDFLTTTTGVGNYLQGLHVDSLDNIYIASYTTTGVLTYKINSSGTAVWHKKISDSLLTYFGAITTDTLGNVYIIGQYNANSVLVKYNSIGALLFQKNISDPSNQSVTSYSAVSKDNFIYVSGDVGGSAFIIKFDSSANIVWQRNFVVPNTGTRLTGIAVDNLGYYYICGFSTNPTTNYASWIAKFPIDGSLTGTYGSFVYQNYNLTTSNSTLPETTFSGLTLSNTSLLTNTPSFSATDPDIFWNRTILGS
jgi:hypothetical protein